MSCEYQPACPGCPRYGVPELPPERLLQLERIAEIFGSTLRPELVKFEGLGSRHRARLSVRGRTGHLGIGIFERGSHNLVSIPNCGVHHPSIRSLLGRLLVLLNRAKVTAYDERLHQGELRAVQLAVEPSTERVQLVLLLNRELPTERPSEEIRSVCAQLRGEESVQGLFLGALPRRDNSLFATFFEHVAGESELVEVCGGARVYYPPGAFGQANPVLHARVLSCILGLIPEPTRIVEYYAGVGALGLGLAAAGHELTFNEIGEGSIAGLRKGWTELCRGRSLPLHEGPAGHHARLFGHEDTVVVDPPRKGLDPELLARLCEEPPRRLVYLSCGIDALLRESKQLARADGFVLRHVSGWAYFPFTDHIETLLVLDRAD